MGGVGGGQAGGEDGRCQELAGGGAGETCEEVVGGLRGLVVVDGAGCDAGPGDGSSGVLLVCLSRRADHPADVQELGLEHSNRSGGVYFQVDGLVIT